MGKHNKTGTFIDGTLVAKLRKIKGLSQEELAEKANLSDSSIAKYEKKKVAGIQPKSAKQLSKKYSENNYKLFCEMADFLNASRSALAFRMEQLGLLDNNKLIPN